MSTTTTEAEVKALPLAVDVPTAGRAFGLGRDSAYRMARAGTFPAPVIRAGRRMFVTRAALLTVLGILDRAADGEAHPGKALAATISPQVSVLASDSETVGGR